MLKTLRRRYDGLNEKLEAAYAEVERIRSEMSDVADKMNALRSVHDFSDLTAD